MTLLTCRIVCIQYKPLINLENMFFSSLEEKKRYFKSQYNAGGKIQLQTITEPTPI